MSPLPVSPGAIWRVLRSVPGRGEDALAALNGAFGDTLAERGSSLAIPMTLRAEDTVLELDRSRLAEQLSEPTGRICVLVHALATTESRWRYKNDPKTTYGSLLAGDRGVTPIYVRYNSGRHVSTNGQELSRLLHRLARCWPVKIDEIDIIGHSMGGLVVRSACYYGSVPRPGRAAGLRRAWHDKIRRGPLRLRRGWIPKVRRVVLLGVPNAGSTLEEMANRVGETLDAVPNPVTRRVRSAMDRRSAGIKDLRYGSLTDEDWKGRRRQRSTTGRPRPVPGLRRARYLLVAGSFMTTGDDPLSRRLGDPLVTQASVRGEVADVAGPFPDATFAVMPKIGHIALGNHPAVYDQIVEWWDG